MKNYDYFPKNWNFYYLCDRHEPIKRDHCKMITNTGLNEVKEIMGYLDKTPYCVTRKTLYDANELYEGFKIDDEDSYGKCFDGKVYQYYQFTGMQDPGANESLARSLHDHGIHAALRIFMEEHDPQRWVGVMGGHAMLRTDRMFRDIAVLSKRLTEEGFIMLSGGGPGAMEATHLGAWMAGRTGEELDEAMAMLTPTPSFRDKGWLNSSFRVLKKYPQERYISLGIPTWLYGHEPSTPFATHIAKFFDNSLREDNILTLAYGGLIYTPGSAGTMQEIFQEAVQNHYLSFGFASPMIFLGKEYWCTEMPVFPLLEQLMETGKYQNLLLTLTDDLDEVVDVLVKFSKEKKPQR